MHKPLLLVLTLLALAGAAWLFSSGESETPIDPLEEPIAERDGKGPHLMGSAGRRPLHAGSGAPPPVGVLQIRGRVLQGGKPVAARVAAWWREPEDGIGTYARLFLRPADFEQEVDAEDTSHYVFHTRVKLKTVSAKDGSYHLEGVPPGELTAFAFGQGWISRELREVDDDSDYNPLAITLEEGASVTQDLIVRRSSSLTGIVRNEAGQPVKGARVSCSEIGSGGYFSHRIIEYAFGFVPAPQPVKTDKAGRYVIPTLISDLDYSLDAAHELGSASVSVRVRAGERLTQDLDLVLPKAADIPDWSISVRVLDAESGAPIEGAKVQAYGSEQTDASGEAELLVKNAESVNLQVSAKGYFSDSESLSRQKSLEPGSAVAQIEMRLVEAFEISGVVLYPDGTPAKSVGIVLGERSSYGMSHNRDWSNADGSFRIDRLKQSDERQTLSAETFHDGTRYEAELQVLPGETDLRITLEVKESNEALRNRSVSVVGPAGEIVDRASVKLHLARPNEYMGGKLFLSNRSAHVAKGKLDIELEYVPFWIEIKHARDRHGNPLGTVLAGPFTDTAKVPDPLTLSKPHVISGLVKDSEGKPVSGVQIKAMALHPPLGDFGKRETEHGKTRSDAAGRFAFRDLGAPTYRISVSTPARWRAPKPLETKADGSPLEFTLVETQKSVITVVNEKGDPIPECAVQAYLGDEVPRFRMDKGISGETLRDGRATLVGLNAEKTYLLEVTPPYGRKDVLKTSLRKWTPVEEQTVVLPTGVLLSGKVVDEGGRPCPRASISFTYTDGGRAGHVQTDEEGGFLLEGLKRGRAKAVIQHGAFTPKSTHEVGVPSSGLQLVHPMGHTLTVAPLGAPSGPYAWRMAGTNRDGKTGYFSGNGKWSGQLEIRGLVGTATYAFWLYFPDEKRVYYNPEVSGQAGTLRPRLAPALTLEGRVVLKDGKPLSEGASLKVQGPGLYLEGSADTNGAFEISGIPAGTWDVSASAWRDLIQYEGRTQGTAGKPFDLMLERDD